MAAQPRFPLFLALASILASVLLSLSAEAQAGLSGNALEGQMEELRGKSGSANGQFGSNNQSALGQLEEMSGGTVDRSSSQSSYRSTNTGNTQPVKPRYNANLEMKKMIATTVTQAALDIVFSGLFDDNSAQQRAEAEARARAEAEALRVQQELARQARIHQAQHYRAEWDASDREISNRLGGAFDLQPAGTSFFGTANNPDPEVLAALDIAPANDAGAHGGSSAVAESDPSVVDLRGSTLVVQPSPTEVVTARMPTRSSASLMPRWAYEWAQPPPSPRRPPSQLDALLDYFGPWLGKWYEETVAKGAAKSALWGLAKRKSQYFGENMAVEYGQGLYSFQEQREDLTEKLGGRVENLIEGIFGEATDVVNGRVSVEQDAQRFDDRERNLRTETYETTGEQMLGHWEMPDAYELKSPVADYNVTPVENMTHADEPRVNNVLFGPLKNQSNLVTHRNINGLPENCGPPPSME